MFDVTLDKDSIVNIDGTSEGTQIKFYSDGWWYKTDICDEGTVEYLVSKMLTFSDLKNDEYILYEYGKINGKNGCRSKNFLKPDYELITLDRIHQRITGRKLSSKRLEFETMEDYIEYTLDFFRENLHIDVYKYLQKTFTLDLITLNEDRHFNNLAVIADSTTGNYVTAPIFDNGKSLLNGNRSIRKNLAIEENVKRVIARPFSGSHLKMAEYFGSGFKVDTMSALQWLNEEPDTLYKHVLMYQLKTYADFLNN